MPSNTLRLLDLFSGIGGFSYAAERIVGGYETVQFVEREPYCQKVLNRHWPRVPIHDDICTFQPELGFADVICGGFPCQDISTAGKRAGIKVGTRSGLFYELLRVVCLVRPQYIVLENVSAILSGGLDTVLGELAEAGFDAEWACIPASAVGACHRRDRWWLVAYPNRGNGESRSLARPTVCGKAGEQRPDGHSCSSDEVVTTSYTSSSDESGGGKRSGWRSSCTADAGKSWLSEGGRQPSYNTANPNHSGLEGRFGGSVSQRAEQWVAWPRNPQSLNPNWRSYLSEPVLCRGDDGLSNRVAKLKALGNSVVPQVAAIPLARVLQLHLERLR